MTASRKPRKKSPRSTNREFNARVEQVAQMLARRIQKGDIKRYAKEQWGVSFRQIENYIRAAREYMIQQISRSKDQLISEALATYEQIISKPEVSASDTIAAQDAICRLFGLYAPQKIAPTTPDGQHPYNPVETEKILSEMSSDEIAALHKANQRMKQIAAGDDASKN